MGSGVDRLKDSGSLAVFFRVRKPLNTEHGVFDERKNSSMSRFMRLQWHNSYSLGEMIKSVPWRGRCFQGYIVVLQLMKLQGHTYLHGRCSSSPKGQTESISHRHKATTVDSGLRLIGRRRRRRREREDVSNF